jgi:hypothetical protein
MTCRSEFAAEGMKMKLRNVTKLEAPGKISSDAYMAAEGVPETLLVHLEATRGPGP